MAYLYGGDRYDIHDGWPINKPNTKEGVRELD